MSFERSGVSYSSTWKTLHLKDLGRVPGVIKLPHRVLGGAHHTSGATVTAVRPVYARSSQPCQLSPAYFAQAHVDAGRRDMVGSGGISGSARMAGGRGVTRGGGAAGGGGVVGGGATAGRGGVHRSGRVFECLCDCQLGGGEETSPRLQASYRHRRRGQQPRSSVTASDQECALSGSIRAYGSAPGTGSETAGAPSQRRPPCRCPAAVPLLSAAAIPGIVEAAYSDRRSVRGG